MESCCRRIISDVVGLLMQAYLANKALSVHRQEVAESHMQRLHMKQAMSAELKLLQQLLQPLSLPAGQPVVRQAVNSVSIDLLACCAKIACMFVYAWMQKRMLCTV